MSDSIFLPSQEETHVTLKTKDREGNETIIAEGDLLEFEFLMRESEKKATEMGTLWCEEFPKLFKDSYGTDINRVQATMLRNATERMYHDFTKKSLPALAGYTETVYSRLQQLEERLKSLEDSYQDSKPNENLSESLQTQ